VSGAAQRANAEQALEATQVAGREPVPTASVASMLFGY